MQGGGGTLVKKVKSFYAHPSCFKLSEYEFITTTSIIVIQVNLSCFLCRLVSYPGVRASCPGRIILPPTWIMRVKFF